MRHDRVEYARGRLPGEGVSMNKINTRAIKPAVRQPFLSERKHAPAGVNAGKLRVFELTPAVHQKTPVALAQDEHLFQLFIFSEKRGAAALEFFAGKH